MQLDHMSRTELEELLLKTMYDAFTGYLLPAAAVALLGDLRPDQALVYVDFCNVHACNHKYSIPGTNARWVATFETVRKEDTIIKFGGDEFVVILKASDADGYVHRLVSAMRDNGVYAVVAVLRTSGKLLDVAGEADRIVSARKLWLEETGRKPGRDDPYICLDSWIEDTVYA